MATRTHPEEHTDVEFVVVFVLEQSVVPGEFEQFQLEQRITPAARIEQQFLFQQRNAPHEFKLVLLVFIVGRRAVVQQFVVIEYVVGQLLIEQQFILFIQRRSLPVQQQLVLLVVGRRSDFVQQQFLVLVVLLLLSVDRGRGRRRRKHLGVCRRLLHLPAG